MSTQSPAQMHDETDLRKLQIELENERVEIRRLRAAVIALETQLESALNDIVNLRVQTH